MSRIDVNGDLGIAVNGSVGNLTVKHNYQNDDTEKEIKRAVGELLRYVDSHGLRPVIDRISIRLWGEKYYIKLTVRKLEKLLFIARELHELSEQKAKEALVELDLPMLTDISTDTLSKEK